MKLNRLSKSDYYVVKQIAKEKWLPAIDIVERVDTCRIEIENIRTLLNYKPTV